MLKSRVHERGPQELLTPEALENLKETMKLGEIATIRQAAEFLSELASPGIELTPMASASFSSEARHKIKLKRGRPRHEEANPKEQEAFKKTSPTPSAEAAIFARGSR